MGSWAAQAALGAGAEASSACVAGVQHVDGPVSAWGAGAIHVSSLTLSHRSLRVCSALFSLFRSVFFVLCILDQDISTALPSADRLSLAGHLQTAVEGNSEFLGLLLAAPRVRIFTFSVFQSGDILSVYSLMQYFLPLLYTYFYSLMCLNFLEHIYNSCFDVFF